MFHINRRTFLSLGAAAACAVAGAANSVGVFSTVPPDRTLSRRLVDGLFTSPRHARAIGRRYLALVPAEADEGNLLAALLAGSGPADDLATLKSHVRRRRQQDFERGDVVVIDGWVLARSETRLCALASLVRA